MRWVTGTGCPALEVFNTPDWTGPWATWFGGRCLCTRWEGLEQGDPSAPFHLKLLNDSMMTTLTLASGDSGEQHIPEKNSWIRAEDLLFLFLLVPGSSGLVQDYSLSTDILLLIVNWYLPHTILWGQVKFIANWIPSKCEMFGIVNLLCCYFSFYWQLYLFLQTQCFSFPMSCDMTKRDTED